MAPITWGTTVTPSPDGDIVRRVPSMASVDVGIQDDILAYVNTALDIRLFDQQEIDPRLKLARIYLALHFATGGAANADGTGADGAVGPLTQESCGVMMRQYGLTASAGNPLLETSWWGRCYLQLMRGKRWGIVVL